MVLEHDTMSVCYIKFDLKLIREKYINSIIQKLLSLKYCIS